MKPLKRMSLLAALALFVCGSHASLAQTAKDFLDNYVGPLKMHNMPIVYAECSYNGGKAMVILPLGAPKARFVELAWGTGGNRADPALANEGEFTVTSKVSLEDLMMGGPGAYTFQTQIIEYLLGMPFTFVYPKDLYSIVGSEPKATCQPSP